MLTCGSESLLDFLDSIYLAWYGNGGLLDSFESSKSMEILNLHGLPVKGIQELLWERQFTYTFVCLESPLFILIPLTLINL